MKKKSGLLTEVLSAFAETECWQIL